MPLAENATRLLAIETADRYGSVAAAEVQSDGRVTVISEAALPRDRRSAQTLAPAIATLLEAVGWTPQSLGLVAVASGPGSFTGLRIGVTTAKALAYAAGATVSGVNTLSALALAGSAEVSADAKPIVAAIDAYRSELFVARFDGPVSPATETVRVARNKLAEWLRPDEVVFSPIADQLTLPDGVAAVTASPTAAAVARLAADEHLAGAALSPFELTINYGRASAAEEKLGDA